MYQKQIARKDFSAVLSSVAGGLASKDLVPILSSFCFDGGFVTTFDDVVTMTAPCSELDGFEGALRGSILTAWLSRQKSDSVSLVVDGTEARFNVGKSRVSMPVMPTSDFQYTIPDTDSGSAILGDSGLTECVTEAARSLGLDPAHQWRLGITLIFVGDGVDVFSSDNPTCVRTSCSVDVPKPLIGRSVVLPPRLVELVRGDKAAPVRWVFLDNVIAVEYTNERTVYCRSLGAGVPSNHEGPFNAFDWDSGFCDLPAQLDSVLDGVSLIYKDKFTSKANISFNGRAMIVQAKTSMGEVHEELEVTGAQQDAAVCVSPPMLQRCLAGMKSIRVTSSGVQLKADATDVLCAVVTDD